MLPAERSENERMEHEQLELQWRQRAEERQRLDEEAREREQQALRELQKQQQVSYHIQSAFHSLPLPYNWPLSRLIWFPELFLSSSSGKGILG